MTPWMCALQSLRQNRQWRLNGPQNYFVVDARIVWVIFWCLLGRVNWEKITQHIPAFGVREYSR